MKAPKSLFDRPGRAAAVVGAVVAVSATATVALLSGTATAAPGVTEPGRCTKNVNVRAEPDIAAKIVALCEEGTAVQVGEARDGFLQLTTHGGWAAQEYVSVNGRAPAPAARANSSEGEDDSGADDGGTDDGGTDDGGDPTTGPDDTDGDEADSDDEDSDDSYESYDSGGSGGLRGLLGG